MGKRSSFERRPQDAYDTPAAAAAPLIVGHLERAGHVLVSAYDLPYDARVKRYPEAGDDGVVFVTNPPWARSVLHPLIINLSDQAPTWVGDYDLAGNDIEANTRHVFERYRDLDWERLALTRDQVRDHRLTPVVKHDKRFKDGGAHEAVENEALSHSVIVQIIRDRLNEPLPQSLTDLHEREEAERARLRRMLRRAR